MSSQYTPDHGTGIYTIENLVTGADYIGATASSFHKRWMNHKWMLNSGYHVNVGLLRDWRLHGAQSFEFSVVERIDNHDELWKRETYWIGVRLLYCTPEENYNVGLSIIVDGVMYPTVKAAAMAHGVSVSVMRRRINQPSILRRYPLKKRRLKAATNGHAITSED